MNESTFTPGGGQPGMPAPGQGSAGFAAVGSVAVRTFAAHQSHATPGVTHPAHQSMDGHHVNAMAGAGLFVRSLDNVRNGDFGIDPWDVVYLTPSFDLSADVALEDRFTYADESLARVKRVPGVEAAASLAGVPFWSAYTYDLHVPGVDSIPQTLNGSAIANDQGAGMVPRVPT